VEQATALLEARGHRLQIDVTPDVHRVYGDRQRLTQIIANLVNNSAKFTGDGGAIMLSLRQDGTMVEVAVIDNGIGIRGEMIARFRFVCPGRAISR
jgi:signal transduction histidine kinase